MPSIDTRDIEIFAKFEVSDGFVRMMIGDRGRHLLFMWDMSREQAGTILAIMDGALPRPESSQG